MSEKTESEILYAFWADLPKVKFVEISKDVLKSHPSRSAILRILRDGFSDKKTSSVRYAMTAEEIRSVLSKQYKIKVSKTGLYFHLRTLEEFGLISVVTRLLKGRHKVAYYARTAHNLFIRDSESRLEAYKRQFGALESLAKEIPLKKSLHNLSRVPEEYQKIKAERERQLGEWLVTQEETVRQTGLDISDLFDALKMIDAVNPRYVALMDGIRKALDI